jgi:hypothetical protein
MSQKMSNDDFLAHFGVRGMRWGVRKDRGNRDEIFRQRAAEKKANGMPTRSALRAKNKIARGENRAAAKIARDKAVAAADAKINAARDQLNIDAANYNTARKQYKTDKQEMGRVAAKRALNDARDQFNKTWDTASELTYKEQQIATAVDIGAAVAEGMNKRRSA